MILLVSNGLKHKRAPGVLSNFNNIESSTNGQLLALERR